MPAPMTTKPNHELVTTSESVRAAREAQLAERADVYRQTGLYVTDDAIVVRPAVIVHCPRVGCRVHVSAQTEELALKAMAAHLRHEECAV